jgi:hypothetical protein
MGYIEDLLLIELVLPAAMVHTKPAFSDDTWRGKGRNKGNHIHGLL